MDRINVPLPVLVKERLPPVSLMTPEIVKVPPATSKEVLVDSVKAPENAPDPDEVAIDPPFRIIGSDPTSACRSKTPPLTVIPCPLEPRAEAFVTTRVPDVSVVRP